MLLDTHFFFQPSTLVPPDKVRPVIVAPNWSSAESHELLLYNEMVRGKLHPLHQDLRELVTMYGENCQQASHLHKLATSYKSVTEAITKSVVQNIQHRIG